MHPKATPDVRNTWTMVGQRRHHLSAPPLSALQAGRVSTMYYIECPDTTHSGTYGRVEAPIQRKMPTRNSAGFTAMPRHSAFQQPNPGLTETEAYCRVSLWHVEKRSIFLLRGRWTPTMQRTVTSARSREQHCRQRASREWTCQFAKEHTIV